MMDNGLQRTITIITRCKIQILIDGGVAADLMPNQSISFSVSSTESHSLQAVFWTLNGPKHSESINIAPGTDGLEYEIILDIWKSFPVIKQTAGSTHVDIIEKKDVPPAQKNKGCMGCYVATAVYGSYDCPEVWTLRRFRDHSLALTWYGRLFITLYYAISPTIVKWFGDTQWFKMLWRGTLDRLVKKLMLKGYDNTPYQDKEWK